MSERHSELKVLRWHDRITDILAGEVRGPIRANLDLTNLCSHHCPWCEPLNFREATIADKRHTLDYRVAAKVLIDLADMDCRAVQFSGGGEPTLHPDFGHLLHIAKVRGMRTLVITHGGFIDRKLDYLISSADHVRVSLDASNEEEHMQMHGTKPGEFGKIVENLRALVKARGDKKTPEVGIAYNVADCNSSFHSFRELFRLAEDLGVDFVQVRPLSEQTPQRLTRSWNDVCGDVEIAAHQANMDRRLAYHRHDIRYADGVRFRIDVLGQRGSDVFHQREFERCYASLTLAVISANGDVSACCDERQIVFGNVNETRFKDIWLSATHRERSSKIVPQLCQRCVMCGFNRSVERYVVRNEAVPELL